MNLKNTKVYSLDEEVIRKYAALCRLPLDMVHEDYDGAVGYADCAFGETMTCFVECSPIDMDCSKRRVITPEEINTLYGFYQTETPEEKEDFEAMINVTNQSSDAEWKNGDACVYYYIDGKEWRDGIYVTNDDGFHVVRDFHDNGYTGVTDKRLRKPETEAERQERERLEAAYDLFCCVTGDSNGYNFEDFCNNPYTGMWFKIVDKTGYKKEK